MEIPFGFIAGLIFACLLNEIEQENAKASAVGTLIVIAFLALAVVAHIY